MEIVSANVLNVIKDQELKEINYNFDFVLDGNRRACGFIDKFMNEEYTKRELLRYLKFPNGYEEMFNDKLEEVKKLNDIYAFYKKYKDDLFSLSFNFKTKLSDNELIMDTLFEGFNIKIYFNNLFPQTYSYIKIQKDITKENVFLELIIDPINDEFKIENILNGKNKVKYLLNKDIIDFINEYNKKIKI